MLIDGELFRKKFFALEIEFRPSQIDAVFDCLESSEITELPSVRPERKKGEWIPQDFNKRNGFATTVVYYFPRCSVCGETANYTNYCPNCGADMKGETDEHNN